MRYVLTIIAGLALLIIESSVVHSFGITTWFPHVAVALAAHIAVERRLIEGSLSILVLAWFADLLSGAPPATTSVAMTVTYAFVALANQRLSLKTLVSRLIVSVPATWLFLSCTLIGALIHGQRFNLIEGALFGAVLSGLSAPLGALAVEFTLGRVGAVSTGRESDMLGPDF